ncbi:unnamed protein product [Amaranthus hypochondriacus]
MSKFFSNAITIFCIASLVFLVSSDTQISTDLRKLPDKVAKQIHELQDCAYTIGTTIEDHCNDDASCIKPCRNKTKEYNANCVPIDLKLCTLTDNNMTAFANCLKEQEKPLPAEKKRCHCFTKYC